jgi:hypothetical protein
VWAVQGGLTTGGGVTQLWLPFAGLTVTCANSSNLWAWGMVDATGHPFIGYGGASVSAFLDLATASWTLEAGVTGSEATSSTGCSSGGIWPLT